MTHDEPPRPLPGWAPPPASSPAPPCPSSSASIPPASLPPPAPWAPPAPDGPTPPPARRAALWPGALLVGAALLALIGAVLPWAEVRAVFFGQLDVAGTEGDGVITLLLGLVLGALGVLAPLAGNPRWLGVVALVTSVVIFAVGAYDLADVTRAASELRTELFGIDARPGPGLYLTVVAGVVGLAGGVGVLLTRR